MFASFTRRTLSHETPSWQSMQLWALSWVTVPGREAAAMAHGCARYVSRIDMDMALDLREIASQVFVVSLRLELK